MPQDFLSQLVQSGALNVWNPMEAYGKAATIKGIEGEAKTRQLDAEAKALHLANAYLQQAKTKDDLPRIKGYLVNRVGMNPELMPDSVDSDEALGALKQEFASSVDALTNAKNGKEFPISWVREDGTIGHTTVKSLEHFEQLKAANAVPANAQYGQITGTPKESLQTFEDKKRIEAKVKQEFGGEDDAKQSDVTKYELVTFGKLVPNQRGTPEYKKGFLQFQRDMKEQSPYVDALNRQIDVTAKREGSSLRKEFYDSPEVKTYQEVSRQHGVMTEAMKEAKDGKNLVAVDQALITIMNKMMDPASVVRESEYARTPGDLALMNRVKGAFEKLKKGGAGLTQEDREAISKMGKKYMDVTEKKYKSKLHEYKGYLTNYGLDPDKYLNPASIETGGDYSKMSDEELLGALGK